MWESAPAFDNRGQETAPTTAVILLLRTKLSVHYAALFLIPNCFGDFRPLSLSPAAESEARETNQPAAKQKQCAGLGYGFYLDASDRKLPVCVVFAPMRPSRYKFDGLKSL